MPMAAAVFAATALGLAGTWHASAGETDASKGTTVEIGAPTAPAASAPLWSADPAKGTSVFEGTETKPGAISVVDDPKGQYGGTYKLSTSGVKQAPDVRVRVETRGHRTPDGTPLRYKEGDTVYVAWRSMWQPLPTAKGDWVVLWQLKDYGRGAATPPLSLRARGDGTVDLEYSDPELRTTRLWNAPLHTGQWHHFVLGLKVSKDRSKGSVSLWYDGRRQQVHGSGVFKGATLRADWVTDKWGVYRSDGVTGAATAYLNGAKVGRNYTDVAH